MKKIISLILLFTSFVSYSQVKLSIGVNVIPSDNLSTDFHKAIIHFNDGESMEGIGRIKTVLTSREEVVVFKLKEEEKGDIWTVKDITGITLIINDKEVKFEYHKTSKYSFAELYEVIVNGKIKLYKGTSIKKFSKQDTANPDFKSYNTVETFTYFLKRDSDEFLVKVKDNYIKSTADFMKDCDWMVKRIKNHTYSYEKLQDLVMDYNDFCTEED